MVGLFVYTGRAGAGTTTCAAATAHRFAARGDRTALVSIDPTQSLSAAFGIAVGPEPTDVRPGLTAVEISPEAGQETYEECFEQIAEATSAAGIDLTDGHLDSLVGETRLPFGPHVAALEAVASFVGDAEYDAVVFDTGLHGRVMRLLRRPGLLGIGLDVASMAASEAHERVEATVESALDPLDGRIDRPTGTDARRAGGDPERPEDADVEAIQSRVERVRAVLSGEGRRELRVVTTPDRVASQWTERLLVNVRHAGIPAGPLIVNKVVEDGECCERCRGVRERQQAVVAELRSVADLEVLVLPELSGVATGDERLERLADRLAV